MTESKIFTLARTGDRRFEFRGEVLAQASTRAQQGPAETRGWEIALYRAETGQYVVAIAYRSQWQGELPTDSVLIAKDAADLAEALRIVPIGAPPQSFPPGEKYDERRGRIDAALQAAWEHAVGELLGAVEPERLE